MGYRPANDPYNGVEPIADKLIGNAYDTVRTVATNIAAVKHVSANLGLINNIDEVMEDVTAVAAALDTITSVVTTTAASASAAAVSATAAGTSATAASASATAAAASASASAASAVLADTARDAAEALLVSTGWVTAASISNTVSDQQAITDKLDVLQTGTGAVTRSLGDKVREVVSVKDFGAVGDGSTDDTAALNLALATGKPILVPPGTYKITAPLTASTEGAGLYGQGAEIQQVTATTPGIIVSANKITISGIYLNSTQAKAGSTSSGIYRAGINYHAGVLQISGDDLTVQNCRFYNWTAGIGFHGQEADTVTLAKNFRVLDCVIIKHDFGILARQFDGCLIERVIGRDCENTTSNPAHLIYITDRGVTQSRGLAITGCVERNNTDSSPYKVRNVDGVSITGCVAEGCGRGIELGTCKNFVISGCTISGVINNAVIDSQQSLITIDESEYGRITGCVINMGAYGVYGVRLRSDTALAGNRFIDVMDCTVIGEWDGTGRLAYYAEGQADCSFVDCKFINTGTGTTNYPFRIDTGCARIRIVNPIYARSGTPTNPERLLRVNAGATDTYLQVDTTLWHTWNDSTSISDVGTTTRVRANGPLSQVGNLAAGDGLVTAPALSFLSDPDCGLYRSGTNTIGMAINGALNTRWLTNRVEFTQAPWPATDLGTNLGATSQRWDTAYINVIGGTANRTSKGWFTDIDTTNAVVVSSDARNKTDIIDEPLGLDFINLLRPVQYTLIDSGDGRLGVRPHHGLLAQELQAVLASLGIDHAAFIETPTEEEVLDAEGFPTGETRLTGETKQGIRYGELTSSLIKAVQELSARVAALETP